MTIYLDYLTKLTDDSGNWDVPGLLDDLRERLDGVEDEATAALDALRVALQRIARLVVSTEGGGPLALLDVAVVRQDLGQLVDWQNAAKCVEIIQAGQPLPTGAELVAKEGGAK